jgi:hypothetical protein
VRFGRNIASFKIFQPLAALGRASIEVFSIHVLCCLAGDSLSRSGDPDLAWWEQVVLLVLTTSLLFLTAHLHRRRSEYRKFHAAPVPS